MELVSIIIPNRNGARTIRKCLEAAFASDDPCFEVIVADDCSEDGSVGIISELPCTLVRMERHSGTARARNAGARHSRGEILFFIDSDCLVRKDTVGKVRAAVLESGPSAVTGGSYSPKPHDTGFFSRFQSAFINYSELKKPKDPDYIAGHAMAIHARTFRESGGFSEEFPLPIIEDVEFSHRLKKFCRLQMSPEILAEHIFNFSMRDSLRNAARKSKYWTIYSLINGDLFSDSGTASTELKSNAVLFALNCLVLPSAAAFSFRLLWLLMVTTGLSLILNRKLISAFRKAGGGLFALKASAYYLFIYPLPVWAGAISGLSGVIGKWPFRRFGTYGRSFEKTT